MGDPHHHRDADVIVVLGAVVLPGGRPSRAMVRRVAHGVRLWRDGRGASLLLTGGVRRHPPAEATVMRDLALAEGTPEAHIVVEPQARSTWENALHSAHLMRAHGWRRALVVTDTLHLPRALLAFRAAGVTVRGAPVRGGWREEAPRTWARRLWHEAWALAWYGLLALSRRRGRG